MVRIILEKRGHLVKLAGNGREAVQLQREFPFDAIFMDMQMPELDGYQATREIRAQEQGGLRRTPIVAMTAYALQGDQDKCLAAGADAYLSKPARPAEILALLEQLLPAAHAPQAAAPLEVVAPAEPATEPEAVRVFDAEDLIFRLGGRPEMVERFVEMFTGVVTGYLAALRDAVQQGDLEQTRIQAHTIKGAAANISAWQLRRTAEALEQLSRAGEREGADQLLQQLESGYREFLSEANSYLHPPVG
jgi:CheY-like chemotaxis protein/HPt (histidine-containing phosphotransfer) domain-containing protein